MVQAALAAAAEVDDPVATARFLLLHAQLVEGLTSERTLLAALKRGDAALAIAAADHAEPGSRTLLYLIVAWSLVEGGRVDEVRQTLERLLKPGDLPRLDHWDGECAAYLLSRLHRLPDLVTRLAAEILDGAEERFALCVGLLATVDPEFVRESSDPLSIIFTSSWLAQGWRRTRGASSPGTAPLALPVGPILHEFEPDYRSDFIMTTIVRAHLRRGDTDQATVVARDLAGDGRAGALAEIAVHHGERGDLTAATETWNEAWAGMYHARRADRRRRCCRTCP